MPRFRIGKKKREIKEGERKNNKMRDLVQPREEDTIIFFNI